MGLIQKATDKSWPVALIATDTKKSLFHYCHLFCMHMYVPFIWMCACAHVCVCADICVQCVHLCAQAFGGHKLISCVFFNCAVFFLRDVSLNLPESWPIYLLLPSLLILRSSSLCLPKARIAGRLSWVLDFYFLTSKLKTLCLCEKHFIHWANPKFRSFLWWGLWHSACDVFTESCPNS